MSHEERAGVVVPLSVAGNTSERAPALPDVAEDTVAPVVGCLDRVGMSGIELALRLSRDDGQTVLTPARATAQVSLDDPEAKGIHMSRLFLVLQQALQDEELSLPLLDRVLGQFIASHAKLSRSAFLQLQFEYLARRSSLLSNHTTWRSYPVELHARLVGGKVLHHLRVRVVYSSTCPCSAALARQLLQQQFQEDFADHRWLSMSQVLRWLGSQGTLATPHSQRSHADVTVELAEDCRQFPIAPLIELVEAAVSTPVQAAVKRRDEQAFARLNGENLMFCEDSARRIRAALDRQHQFLDYRIEASHLESLHPHDAVAVVTKGVAGGLEP